MKIRVPFLVSTFCASIFLFSCEKKEGNISIDGQGNANQLNLLVTDTLTFKAFTIDEDSILGTGLSYSLLGKLNDGLLGESTASIFAQLSLIEPKSNFPNTEEPDSAVLFIPAVNGLNHYGNRNYEHTIRIETLTEGFESGKLYYQNNSLATDNSKSTVYNGQLINEYNDSIRFRKGKLRAYNGLKIKLSQEMAKQLMSLPTEAYENNDNLVKYLKGIAIQPISGGIPSNDGSMCVFDLNNVISTAYRAKILLYYQDTQTFIFGFSGSSKILNFGKTGPYSTEVNTQLNNPGIHYDQTFAQALSGVKTKIEIPYLSNLINNGNVAINKATIEFFIKDYSEGFFAPPRMNLYRPVNRFSNRNFLILDALNTSTYGGTYDPIRKSYKFTITRHIQSILNEKFFEDNDVNLGLYLAVPSDQPVIGARCVIDQSKTKIHITYSKPN